MPGRNTRTRFHRSEEHTSELQSHSNISYAVCCLKKKSHLEAFILRSRRGARAPVSRTQEVRVSFFFNDTATTEIYTLLYTLSLHDALPILAGVYQDQEAHTLFPQSNPDWGLDRVDQTDLPLSGTYDYGATGNTVRVYIIDTGIRQSHVDFGGRAIPGQDEIGDGFGTNDCFGHGTHVSGTSGGYTYGMAKGVVLVAVRVLNCFGSGTDAQVIAGIDYVTAQKNANPTVPSVANMSLGGGFFQPLNDA